MTNNVKTANDMISDSIDAWFSGDEGLANQYLSDAIDQKKTERMVSVLSNLPEFQP